MSNHEMIFVDGLIKDYGTYRAVDKIQFSVKKGDVVGFLGPNGAGKTTTMKIITGAMAPSGGMVKVDGIDVFTDPIGVKQKIGYLPETPPLYGEMTVEEYLIFVARLKGVPSGKSKAAASIAMEKTNITERRRSLIQNLSKGYRQRVGISQALVSDPQLLIMDEPTVGLDPRQVAEVRELIQGLRGSHTIVLSTHILSEVEATCNRVIIINKGKIVVQDTIENLADHRTGGAQIKLRVKTPRSDLLQSLQQVSGVKKVTLEAGGQYIIMGESQSCPEIAEVVVKSGSGLMGLWETAVDLEQIFLDITQAEEVQHTHS